MRNINYFNYELGLPVTGWRRGTHIYRMRNLKVITKTFI